MYLWYFTILVMRSQNFHFLIIWLIENLIVIFSDLSIIFSYWLAVSTGLTSLKESVDDYISSNDTRYRLSLNNFSTIIATIINKCIGKIAILLSHYYFMEIKFLRWISFQYFNSNNILSSLFNNLAYPYTFKI